MTAQELLDMIPTGHRDPLPRPDDPILDRQLRKAIEIANKTGDCIINVGEGYYRPDVNDIVDLKELHEYINKERARASEIRTKVFTLSMWLRKQDRKGFSSWLKGK